MPPELTMALGEEKNRDNPIFFASLKEPKQPKHQKKRHHRRHKISVGYFPSATMMGMIAFLNAFNDNSGRFRGFHARGLA